MLHCSCTYRKLKLEYCNYLGLAPNFSSLSNLETLTLKDRINDLTSLQDLDKLTHLTIHLREENIATLALVCPRNLQQLEIKSIGHLSFFRRDSLAIDMVCCNVIATIVALTWQHR